MAATLRPLKPVMLERLTDAGTWLSREELVADLSNCMPAIEDALADLVLEGHADYREGSGYRLAGTFLARQAAKQLRAKGTRYAVRAAQHGQHFRVGVAEVMPRLGLVMYELSMPLPDAGPEALDKQLAITNALVQHMNNRADSAGAQTNA